MPSYDYKCIRCDKITEAFFLSMTEAPMKIGCPNCIALMGEETGPLHTAKRIISAGAGFTFAQSGGTKTGAKHEKDVQDAMKDYLYNKKSDK